MVWIVLILAALFALCVWGAVRRFKKSRQSKAAVHFLLGGFCTLLAVLFLLLEITLLILLFDGVFNPGGDQDQQDIPGSDWRTYQGYASTEPLREDGTGPSFLYLLYDSGELGFFFNEAGGRSLAMTADLSGADDAEYSERNLVFQDLNFDGCRDVWIPYRTQGGDQYFEYWLWDEDSYCFLRNAELSALPNVRVDAEAKQILSRQGEEETAYTWNGEQGLTLLENAG